MISEYFSDITFHQFSLKVAIEILIFILLLISSALISGSEVAFFSLSPQILQKFKSNKNSKKERLVIKLLEDPDKLLATILITNNFVNIGIVIITTYITNSLIDFGQHAKIKFIYEVVFTTFVILLFGEIIPKVYSNKYNQQVARFMSYPLNILEKIFSPLAFLLLKPSSLFKKIQATENLSVKDLLEAIELTSEDLQDENKILKNVMEIRNIEVREIMTSRVDVFMLECSEPFEIVKKKIAEKAFSRIPVYKENLDNIIGILYIKDLIKYLKQKDLDWCKFIKPPYFVPENKKIDDLLVEFREKKIHLAIVSDEYGGFSGIVTLEDILEEIVGDIKDEFGKDQEFYKKINENTYLFDGKILLKDFIRILNIDDEIFEGCEAETLAGLILDIKGEFPKEKDDIEWKNFVFIIEKMEKTRIAKIKVILNKK